MEFWKDILGFDGKYQISNFGRVKSLSRKIQFGNSYRILPEIILSPKEKKKGYLFVGLSSGGRNYKYLHVHRLVAQAFIPNEKNKKTVNHKDGNKHNNNVENLEWATHSENLKHSFKILGRKNPLPSFNLRKSRIGRFSILNKNSTPVLQFTKEGHFIKKWNCMSDVQRELKICRSDIGACCLKKKGHLTAGGFKWEYENGNNNSDTFEQLSIDQLKEKLGYELKY